ARVEQRQNRMVVGLRDRVAVAVMSAAASLVGEADGATGGLAVIVEPAMEGRAEVEAERFVVVADIGNVPGHRMGVRVGRIALAQNALIPVMEGRGAGLVGD